MKKLLLLLIIVFITIPLCAKKDKAYEDTLFTGGMMYTVGFPLLGSLPEGRVITGLGGRLHFNFFSFFRVGLGGMGTAIEYTNSASDKNRLEINYGGATVEFYLRVWNFRFALGALVGGGATKHISFHSHISGDTYSVSYSESAIFVAIPMVTIEWLVVRNISITLVTDFFLTNNILDQSYLGPRVTLGVMFNK